jgi:hypothetical protein
MSEPTCCRLRIELKPEDFGRWDRDDIERAGSELFGVLADLMHHDYAAGDGWYPFAEDIPGILAEVRSHQPGRGSTGAGWVTPVLSWTVPPRRPIVSACFSCARSSRMPISAATMSGPSKPKPRSTHSPSSSRVRWGWGPGPARRVGGGKGAIERHAGIAYRHRPHRATPSTPGRTPQRPCAHRHLLQLPATHPRRGQLDHRDPLTAPCGG